MKCPKCGYDPVGDKMDMSIYWQRHKRYRGVKVGNSNLPFQRYGCFTVCLSYLVGKDPLEVNKLLTQKGGFTKGGLILSTKVAEILDLNLLKGNSKIPGKMTNIGFMPLWSPTIKEVYLGKSQHFVVRIIRDGKRLIFDPWTGEELPINHYRFKSYRLFK